MLEDAAFMSPEDAMSALIWVGMVPFAILFVCILILHLTGE